MFKFGKNKKSKSKKGTSNSSEQEDKEILRQIHVMPERFYIKPRKNRVGLLVVILFAFLMIGGLAAAAYFLNENLKGQNILPTNSQPVVNDNSGDEDINSNSNNEDQEDNQNINTNTNTNQTATTTLDLPVVDDTTSTTSPQPDITATDEDNDGLTLLEEALYGTNPLNKDSDGDSYPDGAELLNGFDPNSQGLTLGATNLFKTYNSPLYSIIYPSKWTLREQDEDQKEVLFISDVGEFVGVLILENNTVLSIEEWFLDLFPGVYKPELLIAVNNLAGIRTEDGRTYYLYKTSDPSKLYIVTYNNGNSAVSNFFTTFNVLVNNLRVN